MVDKIWSLKKIELWNLLHMFFPLKLTWLPINQLVMKEVCKLKNGHVWLKIRDWKLTFFFGWKKEAWGYSSMLEHVEGSTFRSWQLWVGLGKDPCLEPWRANASQCRQYWVKWTHGLTWQEAASYFSGLFYLDLNQPTLSSGIKIFHLG